MIFRKIEKIFPKKISQRFVINFIHMTKTHIKKYN